MFRKVLAIAGLTLLPSLCLASTYDCVVERPGAQSSKKIWSGKLLLKDEAEADAELLIINKNGAPVRIQDLQLKGGDAAVRAKLKQYDGFLVIGLYKYGQRIDVELGHVDSTSKPNAAPTDARAWSSLGTREIGVMNVRKNVQINCRLE
jgi:hypothetical protein